MIVITTPRGDIGARVLDRIVAASTGERVRVVARDPSKLPHAVRDRVEVVDGSHAASAAVIQALDGATAAFWLPPGSPTEPSAQAGNVEFSRAFADALPSAGVTHVVGVSALGRGWTAPAGLVTASLAMDDLIGGTGVHDRALCCASLMDNVVRKVAPIREQGAFFAPTPVDLALPHVAETDVATVAARLLLARSWEGVEDVPLHGPEDLTQDEMAAIMSDVLGKAIRFAAMSMDQFEGMLAGMGTSQGMARDYALMMRAKNEGMDTMYRPTDRANTPTTFRKWCETELRPTVSA